jgi:hypothetical protein
MEDAIGHARVSTEDQAREELIRKWRELHEQESLYITENAVY